MIRVFQSLPEARAALRSSAVTIGKYDGMHRGHQAILQQLQQEAARLQTTSLVILSEPQPEEFFAGSAAPARLNAFHDKVGFLEQFGIDAVYRLAFDGAVSRQPARNFVEEVLLAGLRMKSIVVGEDFRFGYQRQGSVGMLVELAPVHGFALNAVPPCVDGGERISSTLIRQYLEQGECQRVSQCLGRPYSISGEVVKGRQLGRVLGFPTANIALKINRLPLSGIFVVTAQEGGVERKGVASIGYNPTVSADDKAKLEVFLFDFDGDIYGCDMKVNFLHKLRDEKRFSDLSGLKQQMMLDVSEAKRFFGMPL